MVCCKRLAKEPEPRGFIYVSAARGAVVIFGALFASVALNEFARAISDCEGRILNGSLKASNLLSSLGIVEGVLNAVLSPFMGAFADLTPYRKTGLLAAFVAFVVLVIMQGFLFMSQDSDILDPRVANQTRNQTEPLVFLPEPVWNEDIALLLLVGSVVVQVVAYEMAALLTITYSAELSTDRVKMTSYVSMAYSMLNGMQLLLAGVVTGLSLALGFNPFVQGMVAAFLVAALTLAWFVPGFPMLGSRREVNPDLSRKACGLAHVGTLLRDIFKHYKQLLLLLLSWTMASASLSSITVLSTTYLQFYLGYDGTLTSAMLALALLFSVPGSLLTKHLVKRFDLRRVYVGILFVFGLSFAIAPFVLQANTVDLEGSGENGPVTLYGKCTDTEPPQEGDKVQTQQIATTLAVPLTALFTAIWGVGIGSVYVANNAFYAIFIPGARESSFFGIKVTFAKSLTWLPPTLFYLINDTYDVAGLQYAIGVLSPFFLLAALIAFFIDEEKGIADVSHTMHMRRGKAYEEELHNDGVEDIKNDTVMPSSSVEEAI